MHLCEIAFELYVFVYNYSSVKPQEGGIIVALLGTPLLADPVDKYVKISRKKHPIKLLHKLHNWLRRVCEISTETAKHGRNRQPHNSLNSTS